MKCPKTANPYRKKVDQWADSPGNQGKRGIPALESDCQWVSRRTFLNRQWRWLQNYVSILRSLNCMFQIRELDSTSIKLFNIFLADQNKGSCGRDSLPTLHKNRIHQWPSYKNLKKYIYRLTQNIYFLVALDLSNFCCGMQVLQL